MSRPVSRTRRFWHWLEGDNARDRPSVIRMPPPPSGRDAEARPFPAPPAAPVSAVPSLPEASGTVARDSRAALVAAFNPTYPIRHARDLRGRREALESLADAMLWQRQHAVVHGPRGSGKTSLVRVFADRADRQGVVLIYVSCEAKSRFGELVRPLLQTVPATNMAVGAEAAFRAETAALGRDFSPQAAVALLNTLEPKPIVFILDEFDRIGDAEVRDQIATTMKLLSDTLSPVQILVVGIAASVDTLIASHPSLRRHMTAIAIGPIADKEIDRLVADGGARAELPFSADARQLIVATACGSPYHARVFAYAAGMRAIARQGDRVTRDDAIDGLRLAFDRWSRLNQEDAKLFLALAGRDAETRRIIAAEAEAIARDRARPGTNAQDRERARDLLAPALGAGGFRDETAGPYLIAAATIAGGAETIGG